MEEGYGEQRMKENGREGQPGERETESGRTEEGEGGERRDEG